MFLDAVHPVTPQAAVTGAPVADALLEALVILSRFYQRPCSATQFTAGLPLPATGLTPALFIQAAARADLVAKQVTLNWAEIKPLDLPAVLLLADQRVVILTALEAGQAQIIQPDLGDAWAEVAVSELQNEYSGQALLVRPRYRFDNRSSTPAAKPPRHWYWATLWRAWPLYGEVLVASLLINLFSLTAPLFVMNVYDRVVPNHAVETLWVLAVGAGLVFSFDFLLRSLRGYFVDIASKNADQELASLLLAQIFNTRLAAQPRSAGAFASHLHEFDTFRDFFTSATLTSLIDLPFAGLFVLVIWHLGGALALIPALVMLLILLAGLLVQLPLRQIIARSLQAGAQKQASLIEILSNLENIKALGAEGNQQRRWELLILEIAQNSLKSRFLSALIVNFSVLMQQLAYVAMVVAGVYLISAGSLTLGGLIACTILGGRALAPLAQVASLLTRYQQSVNALRVLDHIMQQPQERPATRHFLHRPRLQGEIELRDLSFHYPDQKMPVLQHLNCRIQAGERVAIIGRTGSGKSTLARLLLGLYEADHGHILLDGSDSRQLDPADLRHNIGYVPQDPLLFHGTLRDNVSLGAAHVEDQRILAAARISGLEDLFSRHPLGFDWMVGERGAGLSGGQRQAIAIARALLLEPPILLFDEPSNAMDNQAEETFKTRLLPVLTDKTLILITHRASLLSLVNRILVFDQGRLIADGPKAQVLEALAQGQIKVGQ